MVMPGRYALVNSVISAEELENEVMAGMADGPEGVSEQAYAEAGASFEAGSIVKGIVTRVSKDEVMIDISYKSEGVISVLEFPLDEVPQVGDVVEALVEEVDEENGEVLLSKRKADRIRNWEQIMDSHEVGNVVAGKAIRKIKGGLLIDIGVPVFLPASQVDIRRSSDVGEYIGKTLECKIIKIDRERRNIVLSRRKLLEEDREKKKTDVLGSLIKGEIRRGQVKNITDFGAFVDLGGIDGLLHITDMSWGRISHPSEVVKIDQELDVKILDFDMQRERISLGLKQVTASPWEGIGDKFPVGSRFKGPVVNIMPYGCFVKLEDGIEGLVHISEMSWTRQVSHPSEMVAIGDEVEVVVLDINSEKHELSLGMKQTEENPWAAVEEKYPTGTIVEGTVRNMTNYGAFIELEEGIDGLLHVNDMSWTKKTSHPSAMLKKGDPVKAVVLTVDQERKRVALGLKQLDNDPWVTDIPGRYSIGEIVTGAVTKLTNFGAFVEIDEELEGLLHISEMADHKVEKPEEVVNVGDQVTVMVINVDTVDRKIGLSLRAAAGVAEGGTGTPPIPVQESSEATRAEINEYLKSDDNSGVVPEVEAPAAEAAPATEEEEKTPAEE